MPNVGELQGKLSELSSNLKKGYDEQSVNYAQMQAEYNALMQQLRDARRVEEEEEARRKAQATGSPITPPVYDEKLATYVDSDEERQKNAARIERIAQGTPTPEDDAWLRGIIQEPISGPGNYTKWYNNFQVEQLTGNKVSCGTNELGNFLRDNGNNIGAFAHITTGPNDENHFVTFDVRNVDGRTQITYVDSNGDLMPAAERAVLEKQFPGVEINYLGRDGQRISEEQAQSNPLNILRVQFDEHNCGMYTTEFVRAFNQANGDEQAMQNSVQQIKESSKNPENMRDQHAQDLRELAGRERLTTPSPAVAKAAGQAPEHHHTRDLETSPPKQAPDPIHMRDDLPSVVR